MKNMQAELMKLSKKELQCMLINNLEDSFYLESNELGSNDTTYSRLSNTFNNISHYVEKTHIFELNK
jgi:hypothetical protein